MLRPGPFSFSSTICRIIFSLTLWSSVRIPLSSDHFLGRERETFSMPANNFTDPLRQEGRQNRDKVWAAPCPVEIEKIDSAYRKTRSQPFFSIQKSLKELNNINLLPHNNPYSCFAATGETCGSRGSRGPRERRSDSAFHGDARSTTIQSARWSLGRVPFSYRCSGTSNSRFEDSGAGIPLGRKRLLPWHTFCVLLSQDREN